MTKTILNILSFSRPKESPYEIRGQLDQWFRKFKSSQPEAICGYGRTDRVDPLQDQHFAKVTQVKYLYSRNLLTHTVNNILQTLKNVKRIQFSVVKQKFNIIHIMYENFKTIPWVLSKIQLI